jgi:hypothetical protein
MIVIYIHKGIARRSFNLGYKITPKFNLTKASAEMKKWSSKDFQFLLLMNPNQKRCK